MKKIKKVIKKVKVVRVKKAVPEEPVMTAEVADKIWHEGLGEWYDSMKADIKGMRRDHLAAELIDARVLDPEHARTVDLTWLRTRVAYLRQERRRHSLGLDTPAKVAERIKALDRDRTVPSYHVDMITGEHKGGGDAMAKDKSEKAPKAERKTVKGFMEALLKDNFKAKLDDESMLKAVIKEFPDKASIKAKGTKFVVRARARFNRLVAGTDKLPQFEDGAPLPLWGERREARKAAKAKDPKAAKKTTTKKKVVKKVKKVVKK
jgi:hypothetical protein